MKRLVCFLAISACATSFVFSADPPSRFGQNAKPKTEAEIRAERLALEAKQRRDGIRDARSQRLQQESLRKQQEPILRQQMLMQQFAMEQAAWERYWVKANAEADRKRLEDDFLRGLEQSVRSGVSNGIRDTQVSRNPY